MIVTDRAGKLVYPGRVHHKLELDAWGAAALPSWLTLGAATNDVGSSISFANANPSASEGYIEIDTGAAASATASLYGPSILLSKMEAIKLTLEGVLFKSGQSIPTLRIANLAFSPTWGAQLYHASADDQARLGQNLNSTALSSQLIDYIWNGSGNSGEALRRRNISFALARQRRPWTTDIWWAYLLEGDEIWTRIQLNALFLTGVSAGAMIPTFRVQSNDGTAQYMRFERLLIEGWTF